MPTPSRKLAPWFEATLFLLLAMAFLLPGLNRGLLFDEYKTLKVIQLTWTELINERLNAGHLPTYFAMVKGWLQFIPYSNWAMRLPGVIFAALGVIPFYYIGRRIAGPSAARWVAFIYVSNQIVLWAGQAARPYGPLLFFEGLTVLAALQWWSSRQFKWVIIAGLASLGGIIFMPLAGLVTLSLILAIAITVRRHNLHLAWPMLLSLGISALIGFAPALLLASSQDKLAVDRGFQTPPFSKIPEAIATMIYGDYTLWARGAMQYFAEILFLLTIYFSYRNWTALTRPGKQKTTPPTKADPASAGTGLPWRTWMLFWVFTPLISLVLVTALTGVAMVSHSRYQAPAIGGIIVIFGVALARYRASSPRPALRNIITVLVLAPLVITAIAWHRDPGEGVAPVVREMIKQSGNKPPDNVAGHVRWFREELTRAHLPTENNSSPYPTRELFMERRPTRINELLIAEAKKLGNDVLVIDYDKDEEDITSITQTLTHWANQEPFWLFAYIQKKDGLDRVAENPPPNYKLTTTIKKGYARAYRFTPIN